MALMLARSLVKEGTYKVKAVREAYLRWLRSGPFDVGNTISMSLTGRANPDSQANALFVMAIAHAIKTGPTPQNLFGAMETWSRKIKTKP